MVTYGYLVSKDKTVPLNARVNVLGRSPTSQVVLENLSISKEHAIIEFKEKNQVLIKDLNSLNGTYINEERIPNNTPIRLQDKDEISLGKDLNKLRFVSTLSLNDPEPTQKHKNSAPHQKQENFRDESISLVAGDKNIGSRYGPSFKNEQHERKGPSPSGRSGYVDLTLPKTFTSNNPYNDIQNQNIDLNHKLLERETILSKRETEIVQLQNQLETCKEELQFARAKQDGLENYSNDLQKRMGLMKNEIDDRVSALHEKAQQEMNKIINERKKDIDRLRILLSEKETEIVNLKLQVQSLQASQKERGATINQQQQLLIEEQSRELSIAKKIINEFENANTVCVRKWNLLIEDNFQKEELIKGLRMQLDRMMENYQNTLSEFNIKFNEINLKTLKMIQSGSSDSSQKEAASFLCDQMRILQEDRKKLIMENEQLNVSNQELVGEVEQLTIQINHFTSLFGDSVDFDDIKLGNSSNLLGPLKQRIDELQDLVEELRRRECTRELGEVKGVCDNLEIKLHMQNKKCEELQKKLNEYASEKSNEVRVDESQRIEFFSKMLEEKDQIIMMMGRQLDSMKRPSILNDQGLSAKGRNIDIASNFERTPPQLKTPLSKSPKQMEEKLPSENNLLNKNIPNFKTPPVEKKDDQVDSIPGKHDKNELNKQTTIASNKNEPKIQNELNNSPPFSGNEEVKNI